MEVLLKRLKRDISICGPIEELLETDVGWYYFEILSAIHTNTQLWTDVPITIKENKKLPSKDTGIDSAYNNISVQSKYRPESKYVSWDEIGKFLSSSKLGPTPFNKLILTTLPDTKLSSIRSEEYEHVIITNEIIQNIVKSLDAISLENIEPKMELRDYQKKALECMYQDKEEIKISLPCGSGKSQLVIEYIKNQQPTNAAIFVPTLLLLNQFKQILDKNNMSGFCLVGTGHNKEINYDSNLFVCVYNSAHLLDDIKFNVIFIDEAHHIYRPEIYTDNETIFDDTEEESLKNIINNIMTEKQIYLSATVDCADYEYSLRDAIDNKYLTDYDITIPVYDNDVTNKNIYDLVYNHPEYRHILAYCNTCDKARELSNYLDKNNITSRFFDGTTPMKKREDYIKDFENGSIRILVTVNVLGEGINIKIADTCMFVDNRESKINVIQCIGRILRLHPEKSLSHIVIPTTGNDEKILTKFLKILATEDFRVADSIRNNNKGRINIIRDNIKIDIKSSTLQYESLYDSFGNCLIGNFNYKYELVKQWIQINKKIPSADSNDPQEKQFGKWCSHQRENKKKEKLSDERINKLELLDGWFWDQDNLFNDSYELIKQWITINKKLPSKCSKDPQEKQFGRWCSHKRDDKKKKKLLDIKIKKLETLTGWIWEQKDPFDDHYDELKQFIEVHKKMPSTGSENPQEKQLCSWCSHKREDKKKGKLTDAKTKKLEKIEGWYWINETINIIVKSFDDSYDQLKQWIEINKKIPSTNSKDPHEKQLGIWCSTQRTNKKKGKLLDDKIKKLEEITKWYWEQEDSFEDSYEKLKQFIVINKKLPSRTSIDQEEKQLGKWCSRKREDNKKGILINERIKKLEELDKWYWDKNDLFDDHYNELKQWILINKKIPSQHSNDLQEKQFGSWCSRKRVDKKKGKLTDDKIKKLEELDKWYWDKNDLFDDHYNELKQFIEINKKFPSLTSNEIHENQLCIWLYAQRAYYKKGKLIDKQINKLEKLDEWFWSK